MSTQPPKRVARVLSIPGDGHRTAVAAHVLAALEQRTGQPLHKLFHLIVGEGAGAVLALLMTLRSPTRQGVPLDATAAAIALEEGLARRAAASSWWTRMQDRLWRGYPVAPEEPLSLTAPEGLLGGSDLSTALTDLAVPVYDTGNHRPYLFRSWKAQGLYLGPGEAPGRFDFRGHDIAAAALSHPAEAPTALRAASKLEFRLAGGGTLAPDPVSIASLQARQLYRRADVIQTLSLRLGGTRPPGPAYNWQDAGARALSQITARGIAEQVLTLSLSAPDRLHLLPALEAQKLTRQCVDAFLAAEESNGFSALVEEYSANKALPHTALRTPQRVAVPRRAGPARLLGA